MKPDPPVNTSPTDDSHSHANPTDKLPHELAALRQHLSVPLLCDALDGLGLNRQAPRLPIRPVTTDGQFLLGRVKTTLWADMAYADPQPYDQELAAVDSCQPDQVLVCAAGGSMRSGIWGELLTTAAMHRGCVGVIADGAVRDVAKMRRLSFPVYARGTSPYDSRDRQRVIAFDVTIELDGVSVHPNDWIAADEDGMVVIPQAHSAAAFTAAWDKAHAENQVREALAQGMSATQAFATFGVL